MLCQAHAATRARRSGGRRHADASQGHRPVDGGDLPDVRPWPSRHHARPRSRARRGGTASKTPAQATRCQTPAQDRRSLAAVAQCCGTAAMALSPQHARLGTQAPAERPQDGAENQMTQKIGGPHHGPQGGGKPGHLVVLLHGYGADGNDLIGLAPVLAPLMPDVVFHAPNAPYPCEGNPMGFQWFGLARLDPGGRLAGVRSAATFVGTFLDETMAEYGLDES